MNTVHSLFLCVTVLISSPSSSPSLSAQRRRKKPPAMRVVALHDSDEEQDSLNNTSGGAATGSASAVPLMNEKRLQRMKDLAKQMPDSQCLSLYLYMPASCLGSSVVECSVWSVECRGFESHPKQLIFLRKSDCLGCAVLLCLVLFDLASFFFPSHLSLNMYLA